MGTVWLIVAVLFCWAPLFGLVLAVLAFVTNRRSAAWMRSVSIVVLGISVLLHVGMAGADRPRLTPEAPRYSTVPFNLISDSCTNPFAFTSIPEARGQVAVSSVLPVQGGSRPGAG